MSIADSHNSTLMVIDIQERLASAMPQGVRDRVIEQVSVLLAAAERLSIPVLVTEQYPRGLGPTEPALLKKLPANTPVIEKTKFSSAKVEPVTEALQKSERKQVFLAGMETHICVLQTTLDLLKQGYEVFVIEDAVSSRAKGNQFNALQRMRLAGAVITNVESLLFEWLGDATHPEFKTLSKLIV
ncbi:hydrolase [Methylophaga sp.]|uniref:hydrolase n=1 Tax=Methylophaga sp. TaxID=2024840 RepID=UPI003F6A0115